MSIENVEKITSIVEARVNPPQRLVGRWLYLLRSPLWICLLITLVIRIWFVIHNNAILEGDEGLVGLQALHILHGDRPIYFYGQPYMGSLEEYLLALIFALVGPSSWALRAEPTILSLLVVWLSWKLAGALADTAQLTAGQKRWFQTIVAIGATLPPLYDLVVELRTYGGYIETFIIALAILYTALRLTQRWQADAPIRELLWRWALLGFFVGLGFWIYPLIIVAVFAAAIWIIVYITGELWQHLRKTSAHKNFWRELALALITIPASLVGFAPALYWGAMNNWQNITYILNSSGTNTGDRLTTIRKVTYLYGSCSALRVVGGALPTASPLHLRTPMLVIGLTLIGTSVVAWGASFIWRQKVLVQARRLISLPLLFAGSCACIFCISGASAIGLVNMCNPLDWAGRYATPLMLALPFFLATTLIFLFSVLQQRISPQSNNSGAYGPQPASSLQYAQRQNIPWFRIGLSLCLVVYIGTQIYTYAKSDPASTFQTSGCVVAPVDNDPIIAYMQQQRIRYAWANGWVGNPITFKSQERIITTDARVVADPANFINRIPAHTNAVNNADRASVLLLVHHDDAQPVFLRQLEQAHITYQVARFPSSPSHQIDLLVIRPLNRTIPATLVAQFATWFSTC